MISGYDNINILQPQHLNAKMNGKIVAGKLEDGPLDMENLSSEEYSV